MTQALVQPRGSQRHAIGSLMGPKSGRHSAVAQRAEIIPYLRNPMATAYSPDDLVHTPRLPIRMSPVDGNRITAWSELGDPATLVPGSGLLVDFGEELVGSISFGVEVGGTAHLEIITGEDQEEALLVKDPFPPEHWYHQPHEHFHLQGHQDNLVTPGRRGFRYVHFLNHGPATIRLNGVRATLERAPVTPVGRFACSDPLLNQAWNISCRTLQLCMQGFYEDGVKRDGMLWIGDYRVEFLCAWPVFADTTLARRSLKMIAHCQRADGALSAVALDAGGHLYPRIDYMGDLSVHGGLHEWVLDNYCADFVSAVWEYGLHSGDLDFARELMPAIRGVLEYLSRVDLTQTVPGRGFITDNQPESKDWWGSRAALGFQLAAAFRDGAKLHALLGDEMAARQCRAWSEARRRETVEKFGDPAVAATRDDLPADTSRSWHAHAAAFHAGAIDATQLREVFSKLQAESDVRRPMAGFQEYTLLEAWLEAGLVREALDEMRSYYGQMLRNDATTTWELVDRREPGIDHIQPAGRSHCHGWSAGPARHLPAHILGIKPLAPGFSEVSLTPNLGDLAWAKGAMPTPHGKIEVEITLSGECILMVPTGIRATLQLPAKPPEKISGGRHTFRL
uniref:alpha-L-rhamnosidase-related protein n=2 Tax=Cephaloticoccus sp. TaxID=1985742 RepID=UPI00404AFF0E